MKEKELKSKEEKIETILGTYKAEIERLKDGESSLLKQIDDLNSLVEHYKNKDHNQEEEEESPMPNAKQLEDYEDIMKNYAQEDLENVL